MGEYFTVNKHHIDVALDNARKMIKAFFHDRDVDELIKYFDPDHFTWVGNGADDILTDIEEVRRCFKLGIREHIEKYSVIDEQYITGGASDDSCVIIAKLKFQGNDERAHFQSALHFSFYFRLVGDRMLVSHYHVHNPLATSNVRRAQYFLFDRDSDPASNMISMDVQLQNEMLNNFVDVNNVAAKSFWYEGDMPYVYVNRQYLQLIGCKHIRNFIGIGNGSSLSHIHPSDQSCYVEHMKKFFAENMQSIKTGEQWKWHGSYYVTYHLQSTVDDNLLVLEWGNVFTLNDRPLINCMILPLRNISFLSGVNFFLDAPPLQWGRGWQENPSASKIIPPIISTASALMSGRARFYIRQSGG